MVGLIALGLLAGWLAVAISIARWIGRKIHSRPVLRPWITAGLAVVVFLMPVADELAAWPSFLAMCREGAVMRINQEKIRGKSLRVKVDPSNSRVGGTSIPIFWSHIAYRDAATNEVLAEYDTYEAEGGMLARAIAFAGSHPLTGSFFCAPAERASLRDRYGVAILD